MKGVLIWTVMFGLLSAYTVGVITHYESEYVATAHASPREEVEERKASVFQRLIERLTFRQEAAERECEEKDWPKNVAPCKKASIFSRLILIFTGHVS